MMRPQILEVLTIFIIYFIPQIHVLVYDSAARITVQIEQLGLVRQSVHFTMLGGDRLMRTLVQTHGVLMMDLLLS